MPFAPKRPCSWPGCAQLTRYGRCEKHRQQERKEIDARRGTAYSRGYDARWQRARVQYLARHPLCIACFSKDRIVAATVVDHITPHKGESDLFWDMGNWQSLCKQCHDSKTVTDGRWGGAGHISRNKG